MLWGLVKKVKLNPRYIWPYQISNRIVNIAYELKLPQELAAIHPVFQIFMLKRCIGEPCFILPTENVKIKDSITYDEIWVEILDLEVQKWRTKEVASSKVHYRKQFFEEATWKAVKPRFWNPNATGILNHSKFADKPLLSFHHNHIGKFAENLKLLKHSEVYINFIWLLCRIIS